MRLVGTTGSFQLPRGRHLVGRDPAAAVRLESRGCSRRHAVICVTEAGVTVEDQASSNGTFVDDERITECRALRGGETVVFSDSLFRVELLTGSEPR